MARPSRLDEAVGWLREALPDGWTTSLTRRASAGGGIQVASPSGSSAELEVRVKSLQTELVAKQVEKALLVRSTQSHEGKLSRGRTHMKELRGADAAEPARKVKQP